VAVAGGHGRRPDGRGAEGVMLGEYKRDVAEITRRVDELRRHL
jgi:hypothetical protein